MATVKVTAVHPPLRLRPLELRLNFFSLYTAFEEEYKQMLAKLQCPVGARQYRDECTAGLTGIVAYVTLIVAQAINSSSKSFLGPADLQTLSELSSYLNAKLSKPVDHRKDEILHRVLDGFHPIHISDVRKIPISAFPVVDIPLDSNPEKKHTTLAAALDSFLEGKRSVVESKAPSVATANLLPQCQTLYETFVSVLSWSRIEVFDGPNSTGPGSLWTLTRVAVDRVWKQCDVYVGFQDSLLTEDDAKLAARLWRFTDLTGIALKPIMPEQDLASLTHTGLDAIYLVYKVQG